MSRPRVSRTVAGIRARSSTRLKTSIAPREEPSNCPVGLYGIRFTLKRVRLEHARELLRLLGAVVHAGEHHVLDVDPAAPQLDVAAALGQDLSRG